MADGETPPWYAAFDADTQKYITDRGLAEKAPADAFVEAAKAHREAQAYIGVPKEQILRLPKDENDIAGWDAVYERLGAPKDASAYDFTSVKKADGTELDQALVDHYRAQAASMKLSPAAAVKFAEANLKFQQDNAAAAKADETATAAKAYEALRQSWGKNWDANQVIADRAYANLMAAAGLTQEQMKSAMLQLGSAMGRTEAMQMLLAAGMKMGEHNFVSSGGGPQGGNLFTRESAAARINELKQDKEYATRWLNGGVAERKEMDNLHEIAFGEA